MKKFAHIINPYLVKEGTDAHNSQAITFESMRLAQIFSGSMVKVDLFTTQYPEDHPVIPPYFTKLPDLKRCVLDIKPLNPKKKLPLIKDILDQLYQSTDAEYLIYTNVDIVLMPQFYSVVNRYIDQGHDALIINRRRVPMKYNKTGDLPMIFSDLGRPHPGFDTFVFHRDIYPKFIMGDICVGINFIGVTLAHNIFCFSRNYKLIDDKHLTIHIGLEVMPNRESEYLLHNRNEFNQLMKTFRTHLTQDKLPYSELPLYKKIIKWGLNPSTFILTDISIEIKGWFNKLKFLLNEIRFKWLSGD